MRVDQVGVHAVLDTLVTALADAGNVPVHNLQALVEETANNERLFLQRVVELGLLPEATAYEIYATQLGLDFENPDVFDLEPAILNLLPEDIVRRYRALPLRVECGDMLVVAMDNPLDLLAIDAIQEIASLQAMPVMCPPETLAAGIEYRVRSGKGLEGLLTTLDLTSIEDSAFANPQRLKEIAGENAIVQLVDYVVDNSLRRKASDIHVEPGESWLRVRIRVDGKLETLQKLPRPLHPAMLSRIKILASMDISERRRPQDGRFQQELRTGGSVEFRVSTLPSVHGEKAVLRILDKRNMKLDLDELGFTQEHATSLRRQAANPNGMVLVTGPTGSGKTTTLYGVLAHLNTEDHNLITVEDPVEYQLSGVTQVQVNPKADRTFANTLRSMLRQDPDVIMVGEIRDLETAEIAIHAALTGHMVLSTLHTNSAISTVTRLLDMGMAPYLLAPTLRAVVAQRLVRRLCDACAEPADPSPELLDAVGFDGDLDGATFRHPRGCATCRNRGYIGRVPLHEVLVWSHELEVLLAKGIDESALLAAAREQGFRPMGCDGAHKASLGLTTLEEVLSAIRAR